jgi:sugar phosphate isomerase/epimerase
MTVLEDFNKNDKRLENAIFGYTGLVGNHISKNYELDKFYNSSNIQEAINCEYNNIYICCIPAVKWLANKYPENDIMIIENIKNIFKTIKAKKVILISTIDVYDNINNHSTENTVINYDKNNCYGRNRYLFEQFIKMNFTNYNIIRLPALFGNGLKKNIIYDLINNNNITDILINSTFQWYNLDWLKNDIDICIKNNIYECNLFTEPLETSHILNLFPNYDYLNNPDKIVNYDIKTIYDMYFINGSNGYIRNKDEVYENIKTFINKESNKESNKECFKLCVSNISNNNLKNEQYYSILKYYGIKYIEVALTKFFTWNEILTDPKKIVNIKKTIESFNLNLYSLQSITYTITNNIFDSNNDELLYHLQKIIDLAYNIGVKNLVFGCPKNRKIIDVSKPNDNIFIDFFSKLGDYIGERDIIISIENNSKKYECNYLNNIKEVGEIVNKINNSHIKMMVDIGNCIMENDNIENIYYYKDIINHIHISMPFMNTFDNYNTKIYTKLLGILKEINYNKIVSLEFINNNVNRLENLNISLSNFVNLLN